MNKKSENKKFAAGSPAPDANSVPVGGFTMVEALVAVSIVLIGVTVAFGTAQLGLSSTSAVRNRVTAMFLAQEALEGVKNLKDSNLQKISLRGDSINWLEGIAGGGAAPCAAGACGFDVVNDSFFNCASPNNCDIYLNGGLYRQMLSPTGQDTGFVRRLSVTETIPGKEARVTVTLTKTGGGFPPFEVESLIYNWF